MTDDERRQAELRSIMRLTENTQKGEKKPAAKKTGKGAKK